MVANKMTINFDSNASTYLTLTLNKDKEVELLSELKDEREARRLLGEYHDLCAFGAQ